MTQRRMIYIYQSFERAIRVIDEILDLFLDDHEDTVNSLFTNVRTYIPMHTA
jgi:hypothetical protein